jgi:hypothetical protein
MSNSCRLMRRTWRECESGLSGWEDGAKEVGLPEGGATEK